MIGKLSDSVEAEIDDFFTDGVVTSSEVVSGVFFTRDQLFWMEELSVSTSSDFVNNGWFEIKEYASWDMFSSTSFTEEGVEGIITASDGLVRRHLAIRLDTVLQAVQFPACISGLDMLS